jgi:hypothetical protein
MNLEMTCILFVKSLIYCKQQICLYVKVGEVRGLEIGQNTFLTTKLCYMCSASCELQYVQIWI